MTQAASASRALIRPEDTKLFSLYFHELWWLANAIRTKAERLFLETPVPTEGYKIQVSPDLHSLIASLLSDAANLKRLLVTPSARLDRESGKQYRLRRARADSLRAALSSIKLVELLNPKVRNTLEHFDEYLDEANIELTEANTPPAPMAAYNMILSHWEVVTPRVYPVRVYISSEKKFYNMKWSVDIGVMHSEASEVVGLLSKLPLFANTEGPGGLMLHL